MIGYIPYAGNHHQFYHDRNDNLWYHRPATANQGEHYELMKKELTEPSKLIKVMEIK